MKGFILAAGEGTRMRPLTANIPKCLLPAAGKPFLQHIIDAFRRTSILDILILVGWRENRIIEYFGDGSKFGVKINYVEQKERLGTAHAVGLARKYMKSAFICINGDVVVTEKSIKGLLDFHKRHKGMVMSLAPVPNPEDFGVVELDNLRIKNIIEKPKKAFTNLINAGIYIFTPKIFKAIDKTGKSLRGEYEVTDSIKILIEKKENVYGYILKEEWIDVGRPWDLLSANEILLKGLKRKIEGRIEKFATIQGNVRIGKGTVIKNGSYIIGPVIIGKDCEIGPNCLIRPSTVIGDKCKIGSAVEVKNSIIMNSTHILHHNYVGDSIIGEMCNLGAGTKIANLRLDDQNVHVILKGIKVNTYRRKLGVIMGDYVKTGINSSIDVGTIIGEESFIGPGAFVQGSLAPRSRIY